MKRILLLTFILVFLVSCSSSGQGTADSQPQSYIENKGSDTIVNLALAWAEQYQSDHVDVRLSVTGGGAGTGIAALVNGTVHLQKLIFNCCI